MEKCASEEYYIPIYKKIRLTDEIYVYRLVDIINDYKFNNLNQTIYYPKNGKNIYDMNDIDFTISENKYCYGTEFSISELMSSYELDDKEATLKQYKDDVNSLIKFCYFDIEKKQIKIMDIDSAALKEAKISPMLLDFYVNYDSACDDNLVTISLKSIEYLLQAMENGNINDVYDFLNGITNDVGRGMELFDTDVSVEEPSVSSSYKSSHNTTSDYLDISELIGLDNIKKEVNHLVNYLAFKNKIKDVTNLNNLNLNMVFYGNPGTGKTTVARSIAKILYDYGYTKNNKFVELTAKDFIAGYVGQTSLKARKLLDENKGGVIFIDEAYIFNSSRYSYANEAIVEILKDMDNKDTIFIFAGYTNEMHEFINMNPGLESRIGYQLEFRNYTIDELYDIFLSKINKYGLKIQDGVEDRIKAIIGCYITNDNFGNGRFIENLIQKILMYHADRLKDVTDVEILTTLECSDINKDVLKDMKMSSKQKIIGF